MSEQVYGHSKSTPPLAVVGIEHIKELIDFAVDNFARDGKSSYLRTESPAHRIPKGMASDGAPSLPPVEEPARSSCEAIERVPEQQQLTSGTDPSWPRLLIIEGDGYVGYPRAGAYDAIHVGAAVEHVPYHLLGQLKPTGVMVVPVGKQGAASQHFMKITKLPDGFPSTEVIAEVRFIPLATKEEQLGLL